MFATAKPDAFFDGLSRLSMFWCFLMHRDASWPINGHYQCLRCHRVYRVPW